jgi:uncharacterized protein (TIGR03435 family)
VFLVCGGTVRYVTVTVLLSVAIVGAQSGPTFEVASVRPAREQIGASFKVEGSRFVAEGATLHDLIARAFSVEYFQVVAAEPWMSKLRYDITARTDGSPTDAVRFKAMLQTLLAERFGLKVRSETKQGSVFALMVDGPLQPAMRRSSLDCTAASAGRDLLDNSALPAGLDSCQPRTRFVGGPTGARITLTRPGITTTQLAAMLTPFAQTMVIDKTHLQGTFDVEVTVSPETAVVITQGGTFIAPQAEGLSLATAVRDQLGLRLRAEEGPTKMLIVAEAHTPSGD